MLVMLYGKLLSRQKTNGVFSLKARKITLPTGSIIIQHERCGARTWPITNFPSAPHLTPSLNRLFFYLKPSDKRSIRSAFLRGIKSLKEKLPWVIWGPLSSSWCLSCAAWCRHTSRGCGWSQAWRLSSSWGAEAHRCLLGERRRQIELTGSKSILKTGRTAS